MDKFFKVLVMGTVGEIIFMYLFSTKEEAEAYKKKLEDFAIPAFYASAKLLEPYTPYPSGVKTFM